MKTRGLVLGRQLFTGALCAWLVAGCVVVLP